MPKVLITCPNCRKTEYKSNSTTYGNPVKICRRCGKPYIDNTVKEPALYGTDHLIDEVLNSGILCLLAAAVSGFAFINFLQRHFYSVLDYLLLILPLGTTIAFVIGFFLVTPGYIDKKRNHYVAGQLEKQKEYDESFKRLQNTEYLCILAKKDPRARNLAAARSKGKKEKYAKRPELKINNERRRKEALALGGIVEKEPEPEITEAERARAEAERAEAEKARDEAKKAKLAEYRNFINTAGKFPGELCIIENTIHKAMGKETEDLDGCTGDMCYAQFLQIRSGCDIHSALEKIIQWKKNYLEYDTDYSWKDGDKLCSGSLAVSETKEWEYSRHIMILMADKPDLTDEEIRKLKEVNITLFRLMGPTSYYDWLEGIVYRYSYIEYPGMVDDAATYAEWSVDIVAEGDEAFSMLQTAIEAERRKAESESE